MRSGKHGDSRLCKKPEHVLIHAEMQYQDGSNSCAITSTPFPSSDVDASYMTEKRIHPCALHDGMFYDCDKASCSVSDN
jgi:hypothetical protein